MNSLSSAPSPIAAFRPNTELSLSLRRSWQRCAQTAALLHDDPAPLIKADLDDRREQHAHFLDVAQPELKTLASLVTSARSVVLLADAAGVILQLTGNTEFLRKAEEVALQPGVSWAESVRGTNAIGTALVDGTAIRVHGDEHFLEKNRVLSCHAAPIFSSRGDIMGVLDISGAASVLPAYALGLAQMCARKISNRLLESSSKQLRQFVFQRQPSLLDSDERAIILLDDERIVGANDAALQLLGADWNILDTLLSDWLESGLDANQDTTLLRSHGGQELLGRLHKPTRPSTTTRPWPTLPASLTPDKVNQPAQQAWPPLSAVAQAQLAQASSALHGDLAVMLQGETGAGKEVFARQLHQHSRWSQGPFVAVNCGALPESLIESELFGYEGGAFTGARREGSRGRLREADGGILFLDEIGDMPLLMQTRLLRALQEREVQPLGSDKRISVNFALISATNRQLDDMVAKGTFRSDLYYRLQDYKVTLRPLRKHPQLRQFLCSEFARLGSLERGMTLSDSALEALVGWSWPGNYREMHSVLRTLICLLPPGSLVQADDLPEEITAALQASAPRPLPVPPTTCLRALNQQAIQQAMSECNNNVSHAARRLGMHRSTLYRRLATIQQA